MCPHEDFMRPHKDFMRPHKDFMRPHKDFLALFDEQTVTRQVYFRAYNQ
jgi:hypothetical protein